MFYNKHSSTFLWHTGRSQTSIMNLFLLGRSNLLFHWYISNKLEKILIIFKNKHNIIKTT